MKAIELFARNKNQVHNLKHTHFTDTHQQTRGLSPNFENFHVHSNQYQDKISSCQTVPENKNKNRKCDLQDYS